MKNSLKERENLILQKFERAYNGEIACDGLHFLGDIFFKDGFWGRKEGNEEEMWRNFCAKKRGLVVITKELNDPDNPWDIRMEVARKNFIEEPTPTNILFYKNLRSWIYCLLNMDGKGIAPDYPSLEAAQECFEMSPTVRINLKKSPGGGSIAPDSLNAIFNDERLHGLICEQLALYKDASIYLDCTRRQGIAYLKELYPDLKPFYDDEDGWFYFSEKNRFLVVNSFHPSYSMLNGDRGIEYYNDLRKGLKEFFERMPGFLG